jgi:hypothetical protein
VIETGSRTEPLTPLTRPTPLGPLLPLLPRLAATYRAMPQSKLLGRLPEPDGRSRAEAGHALAARLAVVGQGIEERDRPEPPVWRALPFDGPFVVGDQISVTGHDLLRVASAVLPVAVAEPSVGSSGLGHFVYPVHAVHPAHPVRPTHPGHPGPSSRDQAESVGSGTGSPLPSPPPLPAAPDAWAPDGARVPVDRLLADILAAARELTQAL